MKLVVRNAVTIHGKFTACTLGFRATKIHILSEKIVIKHHKIRKLNHKVSLIGPPQKFRCWTTKVRVNLHVLTTKISYSHKLYVEPLKFICVNHEKNSYVGPQKFIS